MAKDFIGKPLDIRDYGYTTSNISPTPDLRDIDDTLEMPELNIAPQSTYMDPQDKKRDADMQMLGIVSRIRQSNKIGFAERGAFSNMDGALERASVPKGTRFTRNDVPISQAYDKLNSGKYVPRYKNFIADTNNEERLARQQGFWEKMGNGVAKLATKTLIYGVGGVINPAYGLIEAMRTGNFNAIYNNDFMKFMDDMDVRTNYALPNYYTNEEKSRSFLSKMGTTNFWANDVFGGMAYTFGALASEALWSSLTGGASLAGTAARYAMRGAGRGLAKKGAVSLGKKFMSDVKGASNAYLRSASTASNVAGFANNARFLYTSAGWEASVESFHFMKEAELNFVNSYKDMYERRPTTEEMNNFRESVTNAGNMVFGANVGIVGLSNILQFGKYFGVGGDFTSRIDRNINKFFGVGVRMNKAGKLEQVTASRLRKSLGTTFNVVKRPFTEGVWEEGNQGIVSKAADAWIASRFNPDAARQNLSFMESIGQGFKETYGTAEGRMEIGIGAIIGGLMGAHPGAGWAGFTEASQANKRIEEQVKRYNQLDIPQAAINLATRTAYTNQQIAAAMEGAAAEESGDKYASRQAYDKGLFTKFKMENEFGLLEDSSKNFRHVIEQMSNEDLAKEYNISTEEAQAMKDKIIADYNSRLEDFKAAERYSDTILSGYMDKTSQLKKDYISLNLFLGYQAHNNMKKAAEDIAKLMGDESISTAIDNYAKLSDEGRQLAQERSKIVAEMSSLEKEIQKINSTITEEGQREKYGQKAEELTKLNERIREIDEELRHKTDAFSPIDFMDRINGSENSRGLVDPSMLGSSFEVLKNLDSYIYALNKNKNKGDLARANLLNALIEDYTQSYSDFRSVNDMISRMQDPRFMAKEDARITKIFKDAGVKFEEDEARRPKGVFTVESEAVIDKALADGKIAEDEAFTMKTFARMQELFVRPEANTDIISDEIWDEYESSNQPVVDMLKNEVRDFIFNNQDISNPEDHLSPRQRIVYDEHKGEIDQAVKDLGDSPLSRLRKMRDRAADLDSMSIASAKEVNDRVIDDARKDEADQDIVDNFDRAVEGYNRLRNKLDDDGSLTDEEENELSDAERAINDFGNSHNVDNLLDFVEQNRLINRGPAAFAVTSSVKNYEDLVDHHEPSGPGGEPLYDNSQNIKMLTVKPNRSETRQVISGMESTKFFKMLESKLGAKRLSQKKEKGGFWRVSIYGEEFKLYSGEHASIEISNEDAKRLQAKALETGRGFIFDLQPALVGANSRELLFYDANAQEKITIMPVDVAYGKDGTDIIKDQDVLESKEGDRLIARIDMADKYNRDLWKEYSKKLDAKNAAETKLKQNPNDETAKSELDKASKEFDAAAKKLKNNLVIKLINNEGGQGKFVSVAKAMTDTMSQEEGSEALNNLREKAFKDFTANANSRYAGGSVNPGFIDVGTYSVKRTLPGRPTLKMDIDPNTGKLTVSSQRIAQTDTDKFVTVGYILNGKVHLKDTGSKINYDNFPFATKAMREGRKKGDTYHGVKIPVVVIKHPNGKNYVYPVDVVENMQSGREELMEEIDLINNNPEYITREDLMDINTRAMQLGVSPSHVVRIAGRIEDIRSSLTDLYNVLGSIEDKMDVVGWLNGNRSVGEILTEDVLINLDLSNPFHAPKLRADLSGTSVTPVQGRQSNVTTSAQNSQLANAANGNNMNSQNNQLNTGC